MSFNTNISLLVGYVFTIFLAQNLNQLRLLFVVRKAKSQFSGFMYLFIYVCMYSKSICFHWNAKIG